ncbi:hypothetical protein L1987_19144 [Smallanthus sonchifolius]|uniref:Uncharacterized protein n=1 Tax=Smallanthus sonchifolius TaxID=185202 RepID=A0ACB9J3N4_9ASTR|nr:hypothetical protein L1987_19144 [Smallanthus sonchifolius]
MKEMTGKLSGEDDRKSGWKKLGLVQAEESYQLIEHESDLVASMYGAPLNSQNSSVPGTQSSIEPGSPMPRSASSSSG